MNLSHQYCHLWGHNNFETVLASLTQRLADHDKSYAGLAPVVSHCDLWSVNSVLSPSELVALDWQRTVTGRAELFDYSWVIVFARLAVIVGPYRLTGNTLAFERLLPLENCIGEIVNNILQKYYFGQEIDREDFDHILALILLVLSIYGHMVSGKVTDMGRLVHQQRIRHAQTFADILAADAGSTVNMQNTHV